MKVQKSFKGQTDYGTLYLVPTPIGNLQDMTFRAVETLKAVDFICAEDTRNTGLLLKHFDITVKQISFHEHNAYEKNSRVARTFEVWKKFGSGIRCWNAINFRSRT